MNTNKQSKNIQYISNLFVISTIAVVFLHVNEVFWEYSDDIYWIFANIIENVFYFAAPIFFMITGAMLIDYRKRYGTKEYFKKRIIKTVIPFVFWSIIAVFFDIYVKNTGNAWVLNLPIIINNILDTNYITYYWFFPALFNVYLCIPLLSAIKEEIKLNVLKYALIVGLVFNSLIPFIISVFNFNISTPINVLISGEYVFYAILGYIIHNEKIDRKTKLIIYLLAIFGLLMNLIGTQILSHSYKHIIKTYRGYTNIPCILYSTGIFLLVKNFTKEGKNIINRFVNFIRPYTFSIYLIHGFILQIIKIIFNPDIYSITYRLYMPFIVISICIGIIYLLRKIPFFKTIFP